MICVWHSLGPLEKSRVKNVFEVVEPVRYDPKFFPVRISHKPWKASTVRLSGVFVDSDRTLFSFCEFEPPPTGGEPGGRDIPGEPLITWSVSGMEESEGGKRLSVEGTEGKNE